MSVGVSVGVRVNVGVSVGVLVGVLVGVSVAVGVFVAGSGSKLYVVFEVVVEIRKLSTLPLKAEPLPPTLKPKKP